MRDSGRSNQKSDFFIEIFILQRREGNRPGNVIMFIADMQNQQISLVDSQPFDIMEINDFAAKLAEAGTKLTVDVAACPTAKKAKLITLANAATGRDNVTLELLNADKEAMLFWSADGKTFSYRLPRGGVVILR